MNHKCSYYGFMSGLTGRLKHEHDTLVCMTRIYCAHHHADRNGSDLCEACARLMGYAQRRLEKCPYGSDKPTCAHCPIHCYKPAQRETVRNVMKFAGPRMAWRHPLRSLTHLLDKRRKAEHPMKARKDKLLRNRAGQALAEGGRTRRSGHPGQRNEP